jgi:hypothetical protein
MLEMNGDALFCMVNLTHMLPLLTKPRLMLGDFNKCMCQQEHFYRRKTRGNRCKISVKYSMIVISMTWVLKEELGLMIINRSFIIRLD